MSDDSESSVAISRVALGKLVTVIFYDLVNNRIIEELTDYSLYLAVELELDSKTIVNIAYHLRRYWNFVCSAGLTPDQTTDDFLRRFRDGQVAIAKSSSLSKQSQNTIRATVNDRLRRVYQWLFWLQQSGKVHARLIGPSGCQVLSTLPEDSCTRSGAWYRYPQRGRDKKRYPLLFRQIGAKSKHSVKFYPTEQIRFSAIEQLHLSACSDYLAHRNALLIDIANSVGWRRASINSLDVAQVREAASIGSESGYVPVSPKVQKFGYNETFDVPAPLLERVIHFIDHYLKPFATEKRWTGNIEEGRVFLSDRGRPLQDRTITQIVSKALRAAGAPRWASIHSFRRKFAVDDIHDELEFRKERGLDTSTAALALSTSMKLGHHNPDSVHAYVSRIQSEERSAVEAARRSHLETLELENFNLKEQLRKIEAQGASGKRAIRRRSDKE